MLCEHFGRVSIPLLGKSHDNMETSGGKCMVDVDPAKINNIWSKILG